MNEGAITKATLEAMKLGLEKSVGPRFASHVSADMLGTVLTDAIGLAAGRFTGELAVGLLRQILGIKDKLSRVEDLTRQIQHDILEAHVKLDALMTGHLVAAMQDFEVLLELGSPTAQDVRFVQARVDAILNNLRLFSGYLQNLKLSDTEREEVEAMLDLVAGCTLAVNDGMGRIAAQYFKRPRVTLERERASMTRMVREIPAYVRALEEQLHECEEDARQRPTVIHQIAVRSSRVLPDGEIIERAVPNPSIAIASNLRERIEQKKELARTLQEHLSMIQCWTTLMDRLVVTA